MATATELVDFIIARVFATPVVGEYFYDNTGEMYHYDTQDAVETFAEILEEDEDDALDTIEHVFNQARGAFASASFTGQSVDEAVRSTVESELRDADIL